MIDTCRIDGCRGSHSNDPDDLCPPHRRNVERYGHPTKITKTPPELPDHLRPIWEEMADQVAVKIGIAGMEALCVQVYRLREAQKKITEEGMVVADPKGNPTTHPALKIEKDAQSEIRRWVKDFGIR